jgi:O-antigen/teichoic acid export membrane protein
VGVLVNSAAQIPFALIQGSARPDVTAKLHLVELPFYLAGLWWLVAAHGIEGAAIAWTARVAVDALALFLFAHRLVPLGWAQLRGTVLLGAAGAGSAALLAAMGEPLGGKLLVAGAALAATAAGAWWVALSAGDRASVEALARAARTRRRTAPPGSPP